LESNSKFDRTRGEPERGNMGGISKSPGVKKRSKKSVCCRIVGKKDPKKIKKKVERLGRGV